MKWFVPSDASARQARERKYHRDPDTETALVEDVVINIRNQKIKKA